MKVFVFLLLAAFLNGLCWIILTPIWQYPDEQAHFAQVQSVAEIDINAPKKNLNTSLEVVFSEKLFETERDSLGNNKYTYNPEYKIEYSKSLNGYSEGQLRALPSSSRSKLVKQEATVNPPLYYASGSIVYKVFERFSLIERVFAVRILSLIFFCLNIFTIYKIAKIIFFNHPVLKIALPAMVAFMPMVVFSSTGILPDTLTNLLFSIGLYFSIIIIAGGSKVKNLIILTAIFLVGTLTRQQFIILIPIIGLSILLTLLKERKFKLLGISFSLLLLILLTIINFKILIPEIGYSNFQKNLAGIETYFVWTVKHTIAEVLPWYWGVYKWLSLTLPPLDYQIINRIIAICLLGLLIKTFKMIKLKKVDYFFLFLLFSTLIYFVIFTFGDFMFYKQYGYSFGIQGRYFFPLVSAHVAILLIGFWEFARTLFKSYSSVLILLLVILMISLDIHALIFTSSKFYDVSTFDLFVTEASQYKPEIFKGVNILIFLSFAFLSVMNFLFIFAGYATNTKKNEGN